MIHPVTETLRAYRWQPFVEPFTIEGVDLSAAQMTMQVRLYPDAPGAPLIDLNRNDNPSAEGVAGISTVVVNGTPVSKIQIRINETTLEALLPFPGNGTEQGEPVQLAYDLVIAVPVTGAQPAIPKARWMTGPFLIIPGANQA